jgi:formylglycine-generating enzyme required for sulfatase activity
MSRLWPLGLLLLVGCATDPSEPQVDKSVDAPPEVPLLVEEPSDTPDGMVWIPGGKFEMGSDRGFQDERPLHSVELDGFWMDTHEVTNAQFEKFVNETGYLTIAELSPNPEDFPGAEPSLLVPGALVLDKKPGEEMYTWEYRPGASWKHPMGPGSSLEGKEDHPVVHVCWDDAVAYCEWAGKSLATEAQWEYAARGGEAPAEFIWGDSMTGEDGSYYANIWQGQFPVTNEMVDPYFHTAPVGQFEPNGFGLYDMAGNVWEWCADWFRPDGYSTHTRRNPTGPETSFDPLEPGLPKRVTRGGSFLCADNSCRGYRPTARMKSSVDTGLFHTGFRTVINPKD